MKAFSVSIEFHLESTAKVSFYFDSINNASYKSCPSNWLQLNNKTIGIINILTVLSQVMETDINNYTAEKPTRLFILSQTS